MKKCGKCGAALFAAVALIASNTGAVWAKAVPLAEDALDSIYSADADDIAEGWKLHTGFIDDPDYDGDPDKDAERRFEDYIYADYGGSDGLEEAQDRAEDTWDAIEEDDSISDEEKDIAWIKAMVEETYDKMGKKLFWGIMNLYLTDSDDKEQDYDGEGITVKAYLDTKKNYDMYTDYFGDFEWYALHEKYDGESYEYEKLPVTISFETVDYDHEDDVEVVIAEFTTKSLSPFGLVLSGTGDEAPKTADNMMSYIGLVAVSLAAFVSFGAYICKTRR